MSNELVPAGGAVAVVNAGVPVADAGGHVDYPALRDLPRDVVLDSEDREIAAEFSAALAGAPREFVHRALRWYGEFTRQQSEAIEDADNADARTCRAAMRVEWGSMFEANMQVLRATFASFPPAVREAIESARLDDGTALFNTPAGLRWLFDIARTPASGGLSAQSIEVEIAEIRSLMGDRRSRYWRGPHAERLQARYRQLIDMQAGR